VKRQAWRTPRIQEVSSEVHKSWITCNRGNELRGFLDMARVWHPLISTGIRSEISRVCGDCENNVNGELSSVTDLCCIFLSFFPMCIVNDLHFSSF
jgi:hypothetical protein